MSSIDKSTRRPFETPALNLSFTHFWRSKAGMHIVGTWVWQEADRKYEPAIVLLHAGRPLSFRSQVPVVIPLSRAWVWAAHGDVGDPAHVVKEIMTALAAGYLPGDPTSKADYLRILDAVNTHLPDLISMPPRPADAARRRVIADVTATDRRTGQILKEGEVSRDV
jgi:hypothetical protein